MRIVSTDPDHPGIFAFGQVAVGVVAFGQLALGVIAVGQVARGIVCLGQGAVGVVAVGQGAVGLWHGTGMMGLAGQTGYGLVLHLLPRLVRERPHELPPPTALEALLDGSARQGWVDCRLSATGVLEPRVARIDASRIAPQLAAAARDGCDRAHVLVSANLTADPSGYREAHTHIELLAEQVIAHHTRLPAHLAYGVPPRGRPGSRASTAAILLRSVGWLIAAALVGLISVWPLADALLGD
jgi:hypothetical protein